MLIVRLYATEWLYNKRTREFLSYIDLGENIATDDEDREAKEALFLMLVALRSNWKYPVGYVLIDKVDASTLNSFLCRALRLGVEHSILIRCITMDGTSTNFAAMRLFGCKLGKSLSEINGEFYFEGYSHSLFFTPDPPHILKLARNALAELKVLIDPDGREIKWRFITNLHDEQLNEGLKLGNKLSKKHIEYQNHKMKVSVAAQTLSSSVADAIEFLESIGHPMFQGASATVTFIRKVDRIFDLLNSRNPQATGFKPAMRKQNTALTNHIIESSVNYLSELKDENGVSLLKHRRKTFALGLITTGKCIKKMAWDL